VSANQPVLKWDWDHRMSNGVTLEFRATVSFILAGVPHHATGAWHTSKKAAQRDAAERVLIMLKNLWTDCSEGTMDKFSLSCPPKMSAVEKLAAFCASLFGEQTADSLQWRSVQTHEGWQATVEVCVFGKALHTLQGPICSSEQEAYEDLANRALWYLKAPSHLHAFEASHEEVVKSLLELPPTDSWLREGMASGSDLFQCEAQQRAADQKTVLMTVQNRLQKKYGKSLPPGTRAWEWSFEYSPAREHTETTMPADPEQTCMELCRATVWIAGGNREFQGQWCQGQKAAQLNACALVTDFLDNKASFEYGCP